MSRITATFERLQQQQRKALIPFITAGDPEPQLTVELMHQLVTSGADIIELGVPFSDPMADGPVIQEADERALEHHVSLNDVCAMVKDFRQQDSQTPVVLMGYLNPIEIMGYQRFAELASTSGVDGVIVVDMPPEEAPELKHLLKCLDIDLIFLVSPTTHLQRIRLIHEQASGYLYYVSLKGVTGANTLNVAAVAEKLDEIRGISDLPVGVGFGIKDGKTAAEVAKIADAVVVGSALVKRIADNIGDETAMKQQMDALIGDMRQQMNAATVTTQ